ncbi:MAG: outer membrane protein assembly factor BamD [Chlorobi bacterium]|nr:outer membrane protein assembly factor BamD [Chlorobiota bacterium]
MKKASGILLIFTMIFMLGSCGPYQKALNSKDPVKQYKMGVEMYKKGRYAKAERLFSLAEKAYVSHPQYERLKFMKAKSLYHLKQYMSAGYEFRQFTQLFPKSSKTEEADYYIVKCYDKLTPEYYRDLTYGEKTLEEAERFLKTYPDSKFTPEVKEISKKTIYKFNRKDFENAKLFYDLGYVKSAIKAFNNFLIDHPGSPFKEQVLYYRFLAAADLALNSVESKKKERTEQALAYFEKFKKDFPESKWIKKAENYVQKLKNQQ